MNNKVYEIITERILGMLEKNEIPWRRGWNKCYSVNWFSEKPYRGINQILLDGGEYATFKQVAASGGKVKKGEKGSIVTFWKLMEKEDEATKKIVKIPVLRYYSVFEISKQCEGLTSKRKIEEDRKPKIERAEAIIKGYTDCPRITHNRNKGPFYNPSFDIINIPDLNEAYKSAEAYYSDLYHEMIHSTGSITRLNRPGCQAPVIFGSETYSKEELVAEFGASMLRAIAGIDAPEELENSVAYIKGWAEFIRENSPQMIVRAADYVLGVKVSEAGEPKDGEAVAI